MKILEKIVYVVTELHCIISCIHFQPLSYQMVLVISGSETFIIIYHFLEGYYSTIDTYGRVGYRVTDDFGFQAWEQNIRGKARWMHSRAGSVYLPESTWMGVVGGGGGGTIKATDGWAWPGSGRNGNGWVGWQQCQCMEGCGRGVATISMAAWTLLWCGHSISGWLVWSWCSHNIKDGWSWSWCGHNR